MTLLTKKVAVGSFCSVVKLVNKHNPVDNKVKRCPLDSPLIMIDFDE